MITSLGNIKPIIDSTAFIHDSAEIIGNVRIGRQVSVWPKAVLRGDIEEIVVGDCANIQDCSVIHTNHGAPAIIGNYVTIGHTAILHGCTVGDNSLIGMGAIVLDGAKIGRNCLIGAGSIVTEKKVIPDNSLVIGSPGKIIRQLTGEELDKIKKNTLEYVSLIEKYL